MGGAPSDGHCRAKAGTRHPRVWEVGIASYSPLVNVCLFLSLWQCPHRMFQKSPGAPLQDCNFPLRGLSPHGPTTLPGHRAARGLGWGQACAQRLEAWGLGPGPDPSLWGFLLPFLGRTAPRTCHRLFPQLPTTGQSSPSLLRLPTCPVLWKPPAPSCSLRKAAGSGAAARDRAAPPGEAQRFPAGPQLARPAPLVPVEV